MLKDSQVTRLKGELLEAQDRKERLEKVSVVHTSLFPWRCDSTDKHNSNLPTKTELASCHAQVNAALSSMLCLSNLIS